jgi:hypothetical protein
LRSVLRCPSPCLFFPFCTVGDCLPKSIWPTAHSPLTCSPIYRCGVTLNTTSFILPPARNRCRASRINDFLQKPLYTLISSPIWSLKNQIKDRVCPRGRPRPSPVAIRHRRSPPPPLDQEFLLLAASARLGAPPVGRRGGAPPPLDQELRLRSTQRRTSAASSSILLRSQAQRCRLLLHPPPLEQELCLAKFSLTSSSSGAPPRGTSLTSLTPSLLRWPKTGGASTQVSPTLADKLLLLCCRWSSCCCCSFLSEKKKV